MPHHVPLQLRKITVPPLGHALLYMHASVCAQCLDMCLRVSVCFTRICSSRLDLLAFPVSVAGTELRGYHPKQNSSTRTHVPCRHKTKIQCFYISDTLLSRLLNRKLHFKTRCWCEDTDPRLVSFLSPPLFPQQDPAKAARAWHSG